MHHKETFWNDIVIIKSNIIVSWSMWCYFKLYWTLCNNSINWKHGRRKQSARLHSIWNYDISCDSKHFCDLSLSLAFHLFFIYFDPPNCFALVTNFKPLKKLKILGFPTDFQSIDFLESLPPRDCRAHAFINDDLPKIRPWSPRFFEGFIYISQWSQSII